MKLAFSARQCYSSFILRTFTDYLFSLLEAIEKFLHRKPSRSCFTLFCSRLRCLLSRGGNNHPGTTTESYRTGLKRFLEQLNEV